MQSTRLSMKWASVLPLMTLYPRLKNPWLVQFALGFLVAERHLKCIAGEPMGVVVQQGFVCWVLSVQFGMLILLPDRVPLVT